MVANICLIFLYFLYDFFLLPRVGSSLTIHFYIRLCTVFSCRYIMTIIFIFFISIYCDRGFSVITYLSVRAFSASNCEGVVASCVL